MTHFRSVVLDVDSTLCGVEGIDWLAARRGPEVARRVSELTDRAMNGEIALDAVYGERLALIRPTRSEVDDLSRVYRDTLAPSAQETLTAMRERGIRVVAVSGGIRQAIAPVTRDLDIELVAVDAYFDEEGAYTGFEATSPLTTQQGKLAVVRSLGLARPSMAVGDGATDVAMREAVDYFVAFTGFTHRASVLAAADAACGNFTDLLALALSFSA